MPILPLRFNRVVTLESVTKAYPDFAVATDDQLLGMNFFQGSRNFEWSGGVDVNDPVLIAAADAVGIGNGVDNVGFVSCYGRFDATNFRTTRLFGDFDMPSDFLGKAKAENGGYVYLAESVGTAIGGGDIDLTWWRSAFVLNGTSTDAGVSETVTTLGVWPGPAETQLLINWLSYQVDWPTDKAMVMGSGLVNEAVITTMRLYGLVFDGSTTIEAINIGEFDYAEFTSADMIGNNQADGDNDSAVFLFDASIEGLSLRPKGHLYRLQWTAHPFDDGAGTFECVATEYTLDDAAINDLIDTSTSEGTYPLMGVATHNDCNFMFCQRSGHAEPFMVVISRDWDWYDKVTFVADDADAQTILDSYAEGTGSIAYNEGEGLLYFVSGPSDPFTYCTGAFDPCLGDGGGEVDEDITIRVWGFSLDDHDYAVFRLGVTETLVLDLTTKQWSQWASPLLDYWRPHVGFNWVGVGADTIALGSDIVCGDDTEGVLYILDPETGTDDDPVSDAPATFTRRVTGSATLRGRQAVPCGAVQLTASLGAPAVTGAKIALRTSDDAGHTWLSHGDQVLAAGSFGQVVEWRSLGLMRQPGRLFSFEDDGAAVRISGADLR